MERSNKRKVMVVFGTRPEAIKLYPLICALRERPAFNTVVTVTGQHREMLDGVLAELGVAPDHRLNLMRAGQSPFDLVAGALAPLKEIYVHEAPALVLVHGDTATALAAALAAFDLKIPVGHVEAGLRTHNIYSPYPEEFNRQAVSLIAAYHFAPTEQARQNLLAEGKRAETVFVTGNTVVDALLTTVSENYESPLFDWARGSRLVLMTVHRRESWGEPMARIFRAVRRVVEAHPDVKVVYPLHSNPLIRRAATAAFDGCDRVRLTEPLGVLACHNLMAKCALILTDSGGIQEEACALGKPVLVLREATERPEGIEAGTLRLTGTGEQAVYHDFSELLAAAPTSGTARVAQNPYGDGHAAARIADVIEQALVAGNGTAEKFATVVDK